MINKFFWYNKIILLPATFALTFVSLESCHNFRKIAEFIAPLKDSKGYQMKVNRFMYLDRNHILRQNQVWNHTQTWRQQWGDYIVNRKFIFISFSFIRIFVFTFSLIGFCCYSYFLLLFGFVFIPFFLLFYHFFSIIFLIFIILKNEHKSFLSFLFSFERTREKHLGN